MTYIFGTKQSNVQLHVTVGPETFIGRSYEYQWIAAAWRQMRKLVKYPEHWTLIKKLE